jgi:hypothetical protein
MLIMAFSVPVRLVATDMVWSFDTKLENGWGKNKKIIWLAFLGF